MSQQEESMNKTNIYEQDLKMNINTNCLQQPEEEVCWKLHFDCFSNKKENCKYLS